MSLTSATAPLTHTTANGWKGVSASDSAVAAFGVPGRDARTFETIISTSQALTSCGDHVMHISRLSNSTVAAFGVPGHNDSTYARSELRRRCTKWTTEVQQGDHHQVDGSVHA